MRVLSVIQPSEMSDDFYLDPETGTWKVNFPESGGGGGHTLPDGMQYVLSPSGKVEEETVLYKTFTPRNLLAVSGTTEPFVAPSGRIAWDGVTEFSLPYPEGEEEEVPEPCALLLTHIDENQGFKFDMDAGVSCAIQFGFYHQDLLTTTSSEREEFSYYYALGNIFGVENAENADSITVTYEDGAIFKTYTDEYGDIQTKTLMGSDELLPSLEHLSEYANLNLRPVILLKVTTQDAGVEVDLNVNDRYQAEEEPVQIPAVTTATELKKYKREVEKQITNILSATEGEYYSTAYGIGARAGKFAVAVGYGAVSKEYSYSMGVNASSEENSTAIGFQARSGSSSMAMGYMSQSGNYGTSYGYIAKALGAAATALGMSSEATGDVSLAIGSYTQATAGYTSAIGSYAQASADFALAVGHGTRSEAIGGTCIGYTSRVPSGCDYSIAIGHGTYTTSAQQARIGNIDITLLASTVQSLSDERDKTNIIDADLGLDFINKLRPVVYQFDYREKYFDKLYKLPNREDFEKSEDFDTAMVEYEHQRKDFYANPVKDGSLAGKRPHYGLIAQEFKKTIDELGVDHAAYQHHEINGGCDVHSIGYSDLVPNLIKAIQELSQENKALAERLKKLENK